jgi:PAS domain S-box-containing protein
VPVLEKYGVITDLDSYLWEQVCVWLRGLIDRGVKPVPVSLNVSRINIFAVDVPARLSELILRYDLPTSLIEIEITESAYTEDDSRIRQTIAELRSRGFRVMMDDFGSGYSSLNMLRSVSVDVIKLDAQFLRFNIGEEQKGINILESIIGMTKSLSTPMIVEGVETPALVRYLKDMGVRYMQGFHYYRPMPPDQFEALIAIPGNVDPAGVVLQRNEQLHIREFLDGSVFSDAMLNSVLGPVAFYGWNGDNVDIVRFNSQFAKMIGLEAAVLEERRYHIQQFFFKEDLPPFFEMFSSAMKDKINGAEGIFRVYQPDGSLFWIHLRVYYLRDENENKIFYGSARDMSEIMSLRDRITSLEKP